MMNKRPLLIVLIPFLLLCAIIGSYYAYKSYQASFELVTITSDQDAKISVYRSEGLDKDGALTDKNLAGSSDGKTFTKKMKHGSYAYQVVANSTDYAAQISVFDVTDQPVTIKTELHYSDSKLAAIAESKRAEITTLITNTYNFAIGNYTVATIQAFQSGSWFGVRINPKQADGDTYVLIVKDDNGKLTIATDIPELTVSSPEFPDIPKDVIIGTNQLVKDVL